MDKGRKKTIVNILCIFALFLLMFSPYSHASTVSSEGDDWWGQGETFIANGKKSQAIDTNNIQNALMPIGRTLVTIATIVLTVVTVVMAIKYMMCDSADKKAKLKTQLIGLVVSTIVIYGAQIIWSILYNFMINVTG